MPERHARNMGEPAERESALIDIGPRHRRSQVRLDLAQRTGSAFS